MARAWRLAAACGLVIAASACGAGNAGDDDVSDAGGSDSAACTAVVSFEPMMPTAPATIVARGDVFGASGVITYTWVVRRGGVDVPFTALDADSRDIQFDAPVAGIYDVELWVGGSCGPYRGGLNVMQPGANTRAIRLRFVPPTSIAAPPQERVITISGGADFAAGILTLDAGSVHPITVRTPQAAPVAAYLRFTSRATPDAIVESFSDTAGNASVRLVGGRYDVLVVPTTAALAPLTVVDWEPLSGALTVDGGSTLDGHVLDVGGAPVAMARVSVSSGSRVSTVATTGADGSFQLRWRDGAAVETITVVPPAGSDLPRLDASVELGGTAAITIRHAAVPTSDLAGTLVRVGGAPVASADVLVDVQRASAGTIRDAAGTTVLAQATGWHRRTIRTDATGRLPAVRLLDGTAAVFIAAAGPGAFASAATQAAAIAQAPRGMQTSNQKLKPIIEDALQLARKHGIDPGSRVAWQYIRPIAADEAQIVSAGGDSDIDEGKAGPAWSGSGFFITPDGYFLTNHHVATGDAKSPIKKNITFRVRILPETPNGTVIPASATITAGRQQRASAMSARWRSPPDNWCGYSWNRRSGASMRTVASSSIAAAFGSAPPRPWTVIASTS